ncbi:MAG: serine protease [Planctomycetota bacterium]|nr:MAG: serine protease [Planctomycetota bacterium]
MGIWAVALLLLPAQADPGPHPAHEAVTTGPEADLVPGSVLSALEDELVSLHRRLRPALVRVALDLPVPLPDGGSEIREVLVSGVVIDQGGRFVAPGVVEGPLAAVRVFRFDGQDFLAQPLAHDPEYDLTLFQAPDLDVPPPPLGWPAPLRVGMVTVTLGNAFGLDGTLALGFLAGLNRSVDQTSGLLQLTNPVNPGDGGGLVANRRGEVIGLIKTSLREVGHRQLAAGHPEACPDGCAEFTRSESLSFAVPIERVLRAFRDQLSYAPPSRRWLGVLVHESYRPELAERLGWPDPVLLELDRVLADSPAGRAGLEPGDVLLRLGGTPLEGLAGLRFVLSVAPAGEPLELEIGRGGEPRRLSLVLSDPPPRQRD